MKPVRKRWRHRNGERSGIPDWYRIAAPEVRNGREPVGSTPPAPVGKVLPQRVFRDPMVFIIGRVMQNPIPA